MQDAVTPIMYGISALHDHILFFLSMILFIVGYIFISTIEKFNTQIIMVLILIEIKKGIHIKDTSSMVY